MSKFKPGVLVRLKGDAGLVPEAKPFVDLFCVLKAPSKTRANFWSMEKPLQVGKREVVWPESHMQIIDPDDSPDVTLTWERNPKVRSIATPVKFPELV